ncbi:hypothetical protein ACFL0H_15120 [Thermodesulfobacteriota bacterium]
MKYLDMLKNEKKDSNTYPEALPKLPKGGFDSNDSSPGKHVSENNDGYDYQIEMVIQQLNQRGVSIMDYPASTRHRALILEEQLTEAANKGKTDDFIKILNQWRECFH